MTKRRELPEGGLQPRSAEDARRHPARSERCREVREMLRDHADGDLPPELQQQVEDHVHRCRDCGLALSRAELEVLRLKEALLDPDRREVGPSPEFTAAVMARARAELRREQEGQPTAGFTSRVMRRVERQVERESQDSEGGRSGWRDRWVPLAAAVLLVALVVFVVNAAGGRATHVGVVAAEDAWLVTNSGVERLHAGSELPTGARLRTGGTGLLDLSLPAVAGRGRGGGSRLRLEADSELWIGDLSPGDAARGDPSLAGASAGDGDRGGMLYLAHGRLCAASGGVLDVRLEDGTTVLLGAGDFRLEALVHQRFDHDLFQIPDLRVRLVVNKGQARIWRGGEGTEVVEGRVAYFTSRTPVRKDRAVSEELLWASLQNAAAIARRLADAERRQPPVVQEPWLGRLLHPVSRQPVAEGVVRLLSHLGPHTITTDAEGRFPAPDLPQLVDQFVVVSARAADAGGGLLEHGPRVLALKQVVAGEAPAELVMARGRRLTGWLLDPDNRSIQGVRLLPVLVDEALGLVQPLPGQAVDLKPGGHFVVAGLPATLPPQVSLALVALSSDRAPQVCFSSQHADSDLQDRALQLSMRTMATVRLARLPAARDLQILQQVPGLPPQQLFGCRHVSSNPLREAKLPHGGGATLWLLRDQQPPQALVAGPDGVLRPDAEVDPPASIVALRAGAGHDLYASGIGQRTRFAQVAEVPDGGTPGYITVHQAGGPVQARAGAMVFLCRDGVGVVPAGTTPGTTAASTFLGLYSGSDPLPFAVPDGGYRLLAINHEGRMGHVQVAAGAEAPPRLAIPVQATRSLVLSDDDVARARAAGGIVHLRRLRPGWQMHLTRQVRATGPGELRGLLPGSYQLRLGDGTRISREIR
ncbi:MAG: anti-sigma factor family protein [Planctomycetota bacterium]|jgi:hypothetical protein